MTLPASRDFDAVDSGPLPANTVNALQDAVVDHEARIEDLEAGAATLILPASAMVPGLGSDSSYLETDGTHKPGTAPARGVIGIPLVAGDRINAIRCRVRENSSSPGDLKLYENVDGTITQKGGTKTLGTTNAWATHGWTTADANFPITIATGKNYVIWFTMNNVVERITHVEIDYDHP